MITFVLSAETAPFSAGFCSEDPTAFSKHRAAFAHSLLAAPPASGVRSGETEAQMQHSHFQH